MPDTPVQLRIFVSHSHRDNDACRAVVNALRGAGADVWYDEHNLGAGQLLEEIQREVHARPIFILLLSKNAFAAPWVKRETTWAFNLYNREPLRVILPITVGPIEASDFNAWLFLEDFKRVEAPGMQPHTLEEAIHQTLKLLALTAQGEEPVAVTPQPGESFDDLLTQGKALWAQQKYLEALPYLERATNMAPGSSDAWFNLGATLGALDRYDESLRASERAIALDPLAFNAWTNKGTALDRLGRRDEALAAYEKATEIAPTEPAVWVNKGNMLGWLERYEESLTAFERALALDERVVGAWVGKATSLGKLGRPNDALAASDRALSIDPNDTYALATKGEALFDLGRLDEALAVCERAISLDPGSADAQRAKAAILRAQAQKAEHSAVMLLRLECQQNVKALLDYWAKVSADGVHIPGVGILVGVGMSFQEIEYDKRQCLAREPMPVWGRQVWDSHASIVAQALNDPALISRVYTLYADLATFIARRKELREAFDTPEGEQLAKDYSRWMQAKQAGQGSIDYREEQGTDMKLGAFNEKTRSLWAECQAISQRALQYRDSNVIPEG